MIPHEITPNPDAAVIRYFLGLIFLLFAPFFVCRADVPQVDYDSLKDRISIRAEQSMLFELLSSISKRCGIEIMADPSLDQNIQFTADAQPLEATLKSLMHGMNYLLVYSQPDARGDPRRILAIHLLPQAKENGPVLAPPAILNARVDAAVRPPRADKAKERKRIYPKVKNREKPAVPSEMTPTPGAPVQ